MLRLRPIRRCATKRVVICGGGFGGIAAARRLRALLGDGDEVVLIDQATHFAMGFRKTDEVVGRSRVAEIARPLDALRAFGIQVVNAPITSIDPGARKVVAGDEGYEADAVIVALGAQTAPGAIPGLAEHGIDWYSFGDGVTRAREAVASFTEGRVVVGIFGVPYKCPPAPFELSLLLRDLFNERGARNVEITVSTPLALTIPVLGASGCEVIEFRLVGAGVDLIREAKPASVEANRIVLQDGNEIPFDLLLAVPPHRVPQVVVDAGLAEKGGWIKVDPATLRTPFEGVWALGDACAVPMANGQPMPKSGAFAAGAGEVAAEHIAAMLQGRTSDARFWGDGECYLEVGGGEAMIVRGRFLAEGGPQAELISSSAQALEQKWEYERARLAEWFGS